MLAMAGIGAGRSALVRGLGNGGVALGHAFMADVKARSHAKKALSRDAHGDARDQAQGAQ